MIILISKKKVNELEVALSAIEITELRLLSALENGGHPGAESSILKIKGTEMQQALSELFVEASGEYALMIQDHMGMKIMINLQVQIMLLKVCLDF